MAEKQQQSRQKIDEVKPDLQEDRGELFEKQWNPYDTYIAQDGERYKEFQTQEEVTEKNLELLEKVEELVERLLGGQGMVPPGIGDRVIGTGPDLNIEDPPNGLTLSKREAVRVMAPDGSEEEEEEPYYEEDDDDDDDESDTRITKKKPRLDTRKSATPSTSTQPDYAQLKSQSEQQHAYDARGHRHPGEPHHKLACSEKREQNGKLKYYHNKYNDGCRDVNIRPQ